MSVTNFPIVPLLLCTHTYTHLIRFTHRNPSNRRSRISQWSSYDYGSLKRGLERLSPWRWGDVTHCRVKPTREEIYMHPIHTHDLWSIQPGWKKKKPNVNLSGELKADRSLTSSISLNVKRAIKRSGEQQWIALIWYGPSNSEPHTHTHTDNIFPANNYQPPSSCLSELGSIQVESCIKLLD